MSEKKKTTSTKKKKVEDNNIEKEVVRETTNISCINTDELNHLIEEDLHPTVKRKSMNLKPKKHFFVHFCLVLLMIVALVSLGFTLFQEDSSLISIITSLLISIFTILFAVVSITYNRNSKSMIFISSLLLFAYFGITIMNPTINTSKVDAIPNFSGKSFTEVMKWANKNKILINQEYEYSDMIPEYSIISQTTKTDSLKDLKEITVSISEGPNPSKEIMVPNMISWESDRVIQFVLDNYMSNVLVEFAASDKLKDTVIEQSASGSLKRDDELKLTFSFGEEYTEEEVALIDFKNKSKFEVEFYMKQHQLKYSFKDDFDKEIKKGFAVRQSVAAGEIVKPNDTEIEVTISKGPEIKVPDLTKYSMEEVTEWAIKNKVKLSFSNRYDDSVLENNIIEASYKEGDIIQQGTVVKIVFSRGKLTLPKFASFHEFQDWATEYNIPYEEVHEFSDTVEAGGVISYSYKVGEAIKNQDTIKVVISDGVKKTVPNVIGLTKKDAQIKLNNAGLKVNFVYRNSTDTKDKVLNQSIRAGSEVSGGTTITVTLSNGKSGNSSSGNSGGSTATPTPTPTPDPEPPTPTCNKCSFRSSQITSKLQEFNSYEAAASGIRNYLQSECPGLKVNVVGQEVDGYDPGDFVSGYSGGETDSCSTITITLAK